MGECVHGGFECQRVVGEDRRNQAWFALPSSVEGRGMVHAKQCYFCRLSSPTERLLMRQNLPLSFLKWKQMMSRCIVVSMHSEIS